MILNNLKLSGSVTVISSKSLSHRAIIAASLASGTSTIKNVAINDDIHATTKIMKQLGANIIQNGKTFVITGIKNHTQKASLDCNESGSTLRFLTPVVAALGGEYRICGTDKLGSRPLNDYYEIFKSAGVECNESWPLLVNGKLKATKFEISGNVSSQYITGLMMAAPLIDGDVIINVSSKLESRGYVDLTIDMLKLAGIKVINNNYEQFIIKDQQDYTSFNYEVEGDFSQAAFWLASGVLGQNPITVENLNPDSKQLDHQIVDVIKKMGGKIEIYHDHMIAYPSNLNACEVDMTQIPDLGPIISVLAANAKGQTRLYNANRLRIKESDRIEAMSDVLSKFGIEVSDTQSEMFITGSNYSYTGDLTSHNDHRIAMSIAVMQLNNDGVIDIVDAHSVNKSYPNFFEVLKFLNGGNL